MVSPFNHKPDFIYIGSFSPSYLIDSSVSKGRRGIDFATNHFQHNLIDCFTSTSYSFFSIVSPFFSPVSKLYFCIPDNSVKHSHYLPFSSLPILRNIFEFIFVFIYLISNFHRFRGPFVVFSLHSSFLLAVCLFKILTLSQAPICVVLDDLPSYMFSSRNTLLRYLKSFDALLIRFLSRSVSHFIVLSSHMTSLDFIRSKPCFLLEGFSSSIVSVPSSIQSDLSQFFSTAKQYFVYAGNLSPAKGVNDLIDAFLQFKKLSPSSDTLLLLTGSASHSELVSLNALISTQSDISLLSPLSDSDLSHLLNHSLASVVPTSPNELFARYFFPSKLLHYMSHSSPVICLRLPCIPKEYFEHTISPSSECTLQPVDQLVSLLSFTYNTKSSDRTLIASQSQNFVLSTKSPLFWSSLLSDFFSTNNFLNLTI